MRRFARRLITYNNPLFQKLQHQSSSVIGFRRLLAKDLKNFYQRKAWNTLRDEENIFVDFSKACQISSRIGLFREGMRFEKRFYHSESQFQRGGNSRPEYLYWLSISSMLVTVCLALLWFKRRMKMSVLLAEASTRKWEDFCGERYVTVDKIPTWPEYKKKNNIPSKPSSSSKYVPDQKLAEKVSLFRGNICVLEVDAIQNAAKSSMRGGKGVDGAIHSAAGWEHLVEESKRLYPDGCPPGEAKITRGFKLPAKYLIHTVGPKYKNQSPSSSSKILESCYRNTLRVVEEEEDIRTVAFCCVGTGAYGFPNDEACRIALKVTREWLEKNSDKVDRIIFCVWMSQDKEIYEEEISNFFPV